MRIRHWTLKNKVILHVVVLGGISAVILTFVYVNTQRNVIYAMSQQKAELVGSMIKSSVFLLKKCGRIEDTQAKIHELGGMTSAIKRIRILAPGGRIFASTQPEEAAATLPPGELRIIQDMLSRETPQRTLFSKTDHTIQSLMLVENKTECFGCHSPKNKYNGLMEVKLDYGEAASLLRASQWKGIGLAALTLSLLTFIILRLFERLINRPISSLKDRMKRVQEGDLTVRLDASKEDEIGTLTKSFNVMVENLTDANRKIEDLYNQRIEKAEHLAAFGELAAGLAHEVKNPLSGMKGALEIITQKTAASDPQKEIFQEILVQIDKIIAVVQDFLSYARPKPFHFSLVPPNLFVENAIRLAKTQVNGKDVKFHFQPLNHDVLVCLDGDRMQEVILNLLLNSISAIGEKGNILIVLKVLPNNSLSIILADEGCGIKDQHLPQIFNPFFSTKKEGTGLGLSICKKIIDAHHGTISVRSREGKGTTFNLRLPPSRPGE
jgi:signal transduction histidine kinase